MNEPVIASSSKSGGFRETLKTIVYAVAIALVVRTFAYEPFNIPSGSMKPTLLVGDYLFVSKFTYGYSKHSLPLSLPIFDGRVFATMPERGDVVVFKKPTDESTDYIKRIVGLPGDKIQVIDGRLYINDRAVEVQSAGIFSEPEDPNQQEIPMYVEVLPNIRSHLILDMLPHGQFDNTRPFDVPDGHVFAMGDNRDNSADSRTRDVGFVPLENIVGRAEIIFFSVNGTAALWEIWKWPWAIRYGRLLSPIK